MGSGCCLVGTVFPFGVINIFRNKIAVMVAHIVNVPDVIEFTLSNG